MTDTIPTLEAKPIGWSFKQIGEFAEKLGKELKYEMGGSIESLIEKLGGKIRVGEFNEGDGVEASMQVNQIGDFQINLPSFTGYLRDRFMLAHELGHYVLHYIMNSDRKKDRTYQMTVYRGELNKLEKEANWFAAGFLIPAKEFMENKNLTDEALSDLFLVSRQAIEYRRKVLCSNQ